MGAVVRLRLSPEVETGLARLAARLGSSAEAVASEAVERFVEEELARSTAASARSPTCARGESSPMSA